LSRRATEGAELVVNSLGRQQRELGLRVDAGVGRLEALDLAGKIVATADIDKGGDVHLAVPTDPARASLLRLRLAGGKQVAAFRAFCPRGKTTHYRPPVLPADIVTSDLELGENWYTAEIFRGESFRWVNNDAEVVLAASLTTRGDLKVIVEPGPGLGGQPGQLTVRNQAGEVVATRSILGREEVHVHLPAGTEAGTLFRLHVANGGHPSPPDTRILNFRVMNCTLRTE
jgi:hypothetical protein